MGGRSQARLPALRGRGVADYKEKTDKMKGERRVRCEERRYYHLSKSDTNSLVREGGAKTTKERKPGKKEKPSRRLGKNSRKVITASGSGLKRKERRGGAPIAGEAIDGQLMKNKPQGEPMTTASSATMSTRQGVAGQKESK